MAAHLGEFEQLVLLALIQLGDEGYGISVRDEIHRRTGRDPAFATVYTTLTRLADKGLITSRLGEPTAERGGRRKKYYAILPAGRRAIQASLHALRGMSHGLDTSWGTP
ncbi:MAG: helix-turn-helix transcriptional regulator [Gemmatimonadales bacterium]